MQKLKESVSGIVSFHQKNKYEEEPTELVPAEKRRPRGGLDDQEAKKRKKKPWSLPHWCIYIAWVGESVSDVLPGLAVSGRRVFKILCKLKGFFRSSAILIPVSECGVSAVSCWFYKVTRCKNVS